MKKISTSLLFVAAICFFKPNLSKAQVNVQDSLALVALYNSTDGPHWTSRYNWLTTTPISTWNGVFLFENRVVEVDLDKNNLNGILPSELGNLIKLQQLILSNNKLSGSIPSELGNCTDLQDFRIDNNQINSIPPELSNITYLFTLYLNNNQISSIPPGFVNHTSIGSVRLDHNQLSSLPPEIGNFKVFHLDLSYNQLTNLPPELGNATITTLDLSHNQLSSLPSEIGNLKDDIQGLGLDYNQLKSLPVEFGNLTKLTSLSFSHNQLKTLPSELGNLNEVKWLTFDHNQLSSIPTELYNLNKVVSLKLANNKFRTIPPGLNNFINLNYLDLDSNLITGGIPSALGNLVHLNVLRLDHNQLSDTIPPQLSKLEHLQIVYLNDNQLSGRVIQFNFRFRKKGILHLENNRFTYAGMLFIQRNFHHPVYSPQAIIPIHKTGHTLSVYTGGTYQLTYDTFKWYKNGVLYQTKIADSIFTPTEDGSYYVIVNNSVAKKLTLYSDTIVYTIGDNLIASKINNKISSLSLYPNPAKSFTILSFNAAGKYSITVSNISGKILQTKTGVAVNRTNNIQLNVNNYASGVYLITIVDEKGKKQTIRLSKE